MGLRVNSEERAMIKDEFLKDNEKTIVSYARELIKYHKSKVLLSEKNIIDPIFKGGLERYEEISGNILFVLSTTEEKTLPIQSVAGSIVSMLSASDKIEDRTNAMLAAMEILIWSTRYCKFSESKNGYPMITTKISNKKLIMRNISLPLERPTLEHKKLGSYEWDLTADRSLDELNHMPMTIIPIQDTEPELPKDSEYGEDHNKRLEMHAKWRMRNSLTPYYSGKKIYFNWAADYRVRMYPVGYFFNPQGSELEKNMIGFYRGEELDFYGVIQLKKSIASAYGLDKQNDKKKLEWFNRNKNVLHLRRNSADEPHTFDALLIAWRCYKNKEYVHVPVELDATNSQAQVMAVLLKNRKIAATCNVVQVFDDDGEEIIADLYGMVADRMSDIIAEMQKEK